MKYYRPANENDFIDINIELRNYSNMDDIIKEMIKEGNMKLAVDRIRNLYGYGAKESLEYCRVYAKFLEAKKDFEEGKMVFVEY